MTKVIAIRGAVTAKNNVRSISEATKRLLDRLWLKNGLTDADVVSAVFTVTDDLTAYYPARAAREAGHSLQLFTALEPNIDGALKGCIRVLVTAYSEREPHNVYLNGARALRPDLASVYSVALDGPSGAGKSTVAKIVSKKLGIMYLDTGALYRALGLTALDKGCDIKDDLAVEKALTDTEITVKYINGEQRVFADGKDVSGLIRTPEVSMAASRVSAVPYIRQKLLGIQRNIAAQNSVILDGRDIGTVVLPNAEFKYFLTASAEVRAKRRYDELIAKGEKVTYEGVLSDVNKRDHDDSTRKVAPLKPAYDAVEINSDGIDAEGVAKIIIDAVTEDVK